FPKQVQPSSSLEARCEEFSAALANAEHILLQGAETPAGLGFRQGKSSRRPAAKNKVNSLITGILDGSLQPVAQPLHSFDLVSYSGDFPIRDQVPVCVGNGVTEGADPRHPLGNQALSSFRQ